MPTGYTADIGKGITFEEYALTCARAFGALVTMRDAPVGVPIPDEFAPSTVYLTMLDEQITKLFEWNSMTLEEATLRAIAANTEIVEDNKKRKKEKEDLYKKYNAMLNNVRAWNPPSLDHVEYKNFMLSQIKDSIKFDCEYSDYEKNYYSEQEKLLTGEEWLNVKKEECQRLISYYGEEHKEEVERTATRNKWIKELRESL